MWVASCGCCDMVFNDVRYASPCFFVTPLWRCNFQGLFLCSDGAKGQAAKQCGNLQAVKVSGAARYLGTGTNVAAIHWWHGAHVPAQTEHLGFAPLSIVFHLDWRIYKTCQEQSQSGQRKPQGHHVCESFMVIQWLCRGNFAH